MAVEATHLNLFPPQQLMPNRELVKTMAQGNGFGFDSGHQMGSGVLPVAGALPESVFPFHPSLVCDSVQAKTSMNTDSGLTYNLQQVPCRKRPRDSFNHFIASPPQKTAQIPSFFGDDVLPIIQQYQIEIDRIVSHHTKKMKMEFEERQKQQGRILVGAIGERVMKKLKEKDDQIERMGKLNLALQERVKSLYVENQLWRDLAQTNEATANSLRSNLEQVLAHVGDEQISGSLVGRGAVEGDAESCCGSNHVEEEEEVGTAPPPAPENSAGVRRMCRRCGERESSVLLLPCRHLCLCSACGSTMFHNCPVCNSNMNATVHVNMSS
nr:probable BOI-related E3 ubiquitin-protein ligase 3 [Ipomoea batatas]GME09742.1 probable BOI-related E3 ubiquitin-protein ligase 3 [Ipomoea batatas]